MTSPPSSLPRSSRTVSRRTSVDVHPEGLSDLPADVRRERLIEYFRDRVAAVLGLAPDKVDPDRPLLSWDSTH